MYKTIIKRCIDIVAACILLLFFSPICIVIAVAIRLDSKGPVFADVPERVGQNGRTFKMYKFRSMIENAHVLLRTDRRFKQLYEEYRKGSYKLRNDPRITRVGKFIRKHSLDEIPQFLNVLKGEMSLVGPRAYYPDELENQQKEHPHTKQFVRAALSVKPGITGLWQVSGRSEVNFDKRIAIDAKYARHISFAEDMQIIIKTPLIMITGRGAI